MKKILILLLTIHHFCLAQEESFGKTSWSTYTTDPCFKQLGISYKCDGYSKQTNSYWYNIRFRNTGNKNIHFSYDAHLNSGEHFLHGRFDVRAGQESVWVSQSFKTPPSFGTRKDFIKYTVSKFLENATDDWTLPAFDCNYNTGRWFCSDNCDNNNTSLNQTTNNSNQNSIYQTQQQDNSANQQQELFAKQKIDEEFETKTGTWLEYGQKANSSAKAGDYESAIKYAKLQVSVSANEAQRENAQLWLNEYTNANQNSGGSTNGLSKTTNSNTSPTYVPNPQNVISNQEALRVQNIANTAIAVVQLGMVAGEVIKDAKRLNLEKRELQNKLIGNENLYPDAAAQYRQHLKLKKKSKRFVWGGVGVAIGGLAFTNFATKSTVDYYSFESHMTKIRIGQGIMIGGLGLTLAAIPIKIKSNSKLKNAKSMIGLLNFKANEIQFALNF